MHPSAVAAFAGLAGRAVSPVALDRSIGGDGPRMLHAVATGSGPTVVLVAGAGEAGLTWAPVWPALAERCHVLAYDRAGLGRSDPFALPSGAGSTDDLLALLEHVGPTVLVGHSWGGLLAQLAAWWRPDLVTGLVLVDPSHEEVVVPARLRLASAGSFGVMKALHHVGLSGGVLRGMGRQLAQASTEDREVRDLVERAYVASYAGPSAFRTIVEENRVADNCRPWVAPLRVAAPALEVPVVVLTATDKPSWLLDQVLPLHRVVANAAPQGCRSEVDTGHYIQRERPGVVLEAVDRVVSG